MADNDKHSESETDAGPSGVPTYTADDLLQGHREAIISCNGAQYFLRLTSKGKLILTK